MRSMRLVVLAAIVVAMTPACGRGRTTKVSGRDTTTTLREIVCGADDKGAGVAGLGDRFVSLQDQGGPGRDDCDRGPVPHGDDAPHLLVLGYDCKVRDHTGAVTATTTPNRLDGTCGQLDPIDLDAPPSAAAGAPFAVIFTSAIPADQLESGVSAALLQTGTPKWLLTATEAVRPPAAEHALDQAYQLLRSPTRVGRGPFTLKAPPEPGVYTLCMEARWAGHGSNQPREGWMGPCVTIEITSA